MRSPAPAGLLHCFLALALCAGGALAQQGDAKRGLYLSKAAGCVGCHTEEKKDATPFAGGRALKTPFGTFYGPNITPHPTAGIGSWKEEDFIRALREGVRPDGAHYFPAFPYPSFTRITDVDLRDLWAYLKSVPPSSRVNQEHQLDIPYRWRFMVGPWKLLFFTPGPMQPDAARSAVLNRGAYLVEALGHCGECHSPRNALGAVQRERALGGAGKGVKGGGPNITPGKLKKWGDGDLKGFLQTGLTPEGEFASDTMSEVVTNTTSQLTAADLDALVAYLRSVPARE